MDWNLDEAMAYYQKQGAPGDQTALVSLLREVQSAWGGIPQWTLARMGEFFGIKESFLLAVVKRIPSLRMENTHLLELCAGPNCSRKGKLAEVVEKTYGKNPKGFTVKYTGCMRLCGKGPNVKWDGKVYHGADEALIRRLVENNEKP